METTAVSEFQCLCTTAADKYFQHPLQTVPDVPNPSLNIDQPKYIKDHNKHSSKLQTLEDTKRKRKPN